ncbi:MAG: cytochrome P450 [Terricaulis sp.]
MGSQHDESALPSGLKLSELDPTFRDAPHVRLDRLRRQAPRYLDPCSGGSRLFLTRHGDVRTALIDRALTRDAKKAPDRGADVAAGTLLSMEGDKHRMGRKLVGRALDARATEAKRALVVAIVDDLLDAVEVRGSFDGVADFAAPVPLLTIADILGLPRGDSVALKNWSADAGILTMLPSRTAEQDGQLGAATKALQSYVLAAVKARRAAPGDDLISELIAADVNGLHLSNEEIAPLCLLLLVAGNLTTTDVIGNAIMLLLDHPEQLEQLRVKPELIDATVEEVLRFDPPVSAVARHLPEEGEYLGCPLPAGGTVKASILAANRDPEVFSDPHVFRIDRTRREHVSFGGGAHACPGAALARLEAAVAIERLFARFPRLRLSGEAPRKVAYGFRGFAELPLTIG